MNEQSELSKAIEYVSQRLMPLSDMTPFEFDKIVAAAKHSQELQQKLDEANARSEMWAKSAGGFAGEREALEQSSREKDELIERLVEALKSDKLWLLQLNNNCYPLPFPTSNHWKRYAFDLNSNAIELAQSKGYGQQKEK